MADNKLLKTVSRGSGSGSGEAESVRSWTDQGMILGLEADVGADISRAAAALHASYHHAHSVAALPRQLRCFR
jgi:hypothetical protein